jgi:hypothetical protein
MLCCAEGCMYMSIDVQVWVHVSQGWRCRCIELDAHVSMDAELAQGLTGQANIRCYSPLLLAAMQWHPHIPGAPRYLIPPHLTLCMATAASHAYISLTHSAGHTHCRSHVTSVRILAPSAPPQLKRPAPVRRQPAALEHVLSRHTPQQSSGS